MKKEEQEEVYVELIHELRQIAEDRRGALDLADEMVREAAQELVEARFHAKQLRRMATRKLVQATDSARDQGLRSVEILDAVQLSGQTMRDMRRTVASWK